MSNFYCLVYRANLIININSFFYPIFKFFNSRVRTNTYFRNKFSTDFQEDSTKADIKLVLNNHSDPIYIRYVDRLPGNDYRINFTSETSVEEDDEGTKFVRRNEKGDILYKIPNNNTVRVILENGKEIIHIKAASKVTVDGTTMMQKVDTFSPDLKRLIKSFRDNIRSFVPLMNNSLNGKYAVTKDGQKELVDFSLNITTLSLFSKFNNFAGTTSKFSKDWFTNNKEILLDQLSNKMYAS